MTNITVILKDIYTVQVHDCTMPQNALSVRNQLPTDVVQPNPKNDLAKVL